MAEWLVVTQMTSNAAETEKVTVYPVPDVSDLVIEPTTPALRRRIWGRKRSSCPRCDELPRDASGWCAPCAATLGAGAGVPEGHPVLETIDAMNRGDFERIAAVAAPNHVEITQGRRSVGAERLARTVRAGTSKFRDYSYRPEILVADPSEPGVVWARAVAGGNGRLSSAGDWQQHVRRWRVAGGKITETQTFAPLPAAITSRTSRR